MSSQAKSSSSVRYEANEVIAWLELGANVDNNLSEIGTVSCQHVLPNIHKSLLIMFKNKNIFKYLKYVSN